MEIKPLTSSSTLTPELPDVSEPSKAFSAPPVEQVGMGRVELPLSLEIGGKTWQVPAQVEVAVSLDDPQARGIHMSRLYNLLTSSLAEDKLSPRKVMQILDELKQSQKGLSSSAYLKLDFQWPLLRKALISDLQGWRQYPVSWEAELVEGEKKLRIGFEVLYSSTCPCSTALSEQLMQEELNQRPTHAPFRLPATPHAQRSRARFVLEFAADTVVPPMTRLIDGAEETLGTPVQTAVKRVDEQEFARLNALHQMFCEDAVRKLKIWLESMNSVVDYWVEVRHEESLHAHDAVARAVKGRPEGFRVTHKL